MHDYEAFIASKTVAIQPTGLSAIPSIDWSNVKPHARDLTIWALKRGRAAIFADTGLSKSRMEMVWCSHAGRRSLLLAPLSVGPQLKIEGQAVGVSSTLCRENEDVRDGVNITNYDRLHKLDPAQFDAVALDECFPSDTLIDTPSGPVPIQSLRVGDLIMNASGVDLVADLHRREVKYAVRISVAGRNIVCSPNHPFFTGRGWVCAQDIEPGDQLVSCLSAMRLVRYGLRPKMETIWQSPAAAVLRAILLSEMADEYAGTQGESPQPVGSGETGQIDLAMAALGRPESCGQGCGLRGNQTDAVAGHAGADLPPIERDRPRAFRAWGKRAGIDRAATLALGGSWSDVGAGICFVAGATDSRLSDLLQDRLGAARAASRYRGGWALARQSTGAGREEGRETAVARVDGLEVLEQRHPDLDRLRDADGKLYFYDIGATRHPSFSIHGLLVHNSSIIKHHEAKTLAQLMAAFSRTPMRLCATATPSPNDYTELGTHAEFLGICTRLEMLAEFFVHDGGETQTWRLKGHARQAFWKWVAQWASLVRRPSDLGYDDAGYILPPYKLTHHTIAASAETVKSAGLLFAAPAQTLTERRTARRASVGQRVAECAAKVNSHDEQAIVWCDLNVESEALSDLIRGAIEVAGSMDTDEKEAALADFIGGRHRVLVSKASICAWGLNLQFCRRMAFVGVTDSWEAFYQAIRRIWRFGQLRECEIDVYASDVEGAVVANLERKARDASEMSEELARETRAAITGAVGGAVREVNEYRPPKIRIPAWIQSNPEAP